MTTKSFKELLNKSFEIGFNDEKRIIWFINDCPWLNIEWKEGNGFIFDYKKNTFVAHITIDSVPRLVDALNLCGLSVLAKQVTYNFIDSGRCPEIKEDIVK